MYCICCNKNNVHPSINNTMKRDLNKSEEELLWQKENLGDRTLTIDDKEIDNGIIHIIAAGYGSSHDGTHLILAICDECISKKLDDGTILFFHDYIFTHDEYIKDSIDKSKQIYRRRKNLDDLTEV